MADKDTENGSVFPEEYLLPGQKTPKQVKFKEDIPLQVQNGLNSYTTQKKIGPIGRKRRQSDTTVR